jgi:long-chain acyl-CoA synthetase
MGDFLRSLDYRRNLLCAGQTVTSTELEASVDELARYLAHGMRSRSPFVFLFAPNHVKTFAAYFAIVRSGSIVVLLDPKIGCLELQEITALTPPAAVIRIDPTHFVFDYASEVAFCRREEEPEVLSECEGVCTIVYSAAMDGYAKPVMLTQQNLLADAQGTVNQEPDCYRRVRGGVCSALLPLHSMFGWQSGLLSPILVDMSILIAEHGTISQLLACAEDIGRHQSRIVSMISPMCRLLATASEIEHQFDTVEFFISGGCSLAPEVAIAFREKFGRPIREGYGLTEASPIYAHNHEDRPGSVGKALDSCEVKTMDADDREAPEGVVGEVCVRGANVMKGYYGDPAATRTALRNGWLHTGDLGRLDGDGYLYLTGLKKRMLNMGGRKIYPAEVERLLQSCDNVESVEVFRRPARLCGDAAQARVRLKRRTPEAEKAFRQWCSRNISAYKIPKPIEFL